MFINVLANLIAGLILYLLGVLAGLFPENPKAFASALSWLLFFASILPLIASGLLKGRPKLVLGIGGSLLYSGALIGEGFAGKTMDGLGPATTWEAVADVILGLMMIGVTCGLVYELGTERRKDFTERKTRPKLKEPTIRMARRRPNRTGRRQTVK